MIRQRMPEEVAAIEKIYSEFDPDFLKECQPDVEGVEKHTGYPW